MHRHLACVLALVAAQAGTVAQEWRGTTNAFRCLGYDLSGAVGLNHSSASAAKSKGSAMIIPEMPVSPSSAMYDHFWDCNA